MFSLLAPVGSAAGSVYLDSGSAVDRWAETGAALVEPVLALAVCRKTAFLSHRKSIIHKFFIY